MLQFNNITIATKDGKEVCKDISFALSPGETTVLLGPNGSGKSSFLQGIMGHPNYRVESGSLVLGGEDITALPTEEKAKRGLFLSLQHVPEIPGVTMTNFLHRAEMAISGKHTPIPEFYERLKTLTQELAIDQGVLRRELNTGFSGGEKKISEILQMALLCPAFAFLDEIDSGVDVDALERILAGVERIRKEGTGILLITHYPTLLKRLSPDHVIVMVGGKIVARGEGSLAEELLSKGFTSYESVA